MEERRGRKVNPGEVPAARPGGKWHSSPRWKGQGRASADPPLLSLPPFPGQAPVPRSLTCSALVPGQNEGTISVTEGETLYVIEEDKGDGWTRIRRNEDEEGYVPTSYVEVYLDKNAKGAKTYI